MHRLIFKRNYIDLQTNSYFLLQTIQAIFSRIMHKSFLLIAISSVLLISCNGCDPGTAETAGKPIIYLYPEKKMDLTVTLDLKGTMDYSYPVIHQNQWNVQANPSGQIYDYNSKRDFYALFWEGHGKIQPDDSTGFVVSADSLEIFFEQALSKIGLNYKESQEFIVYWVPRMKTNPYSFVHFSFKNYAEFAKLAVKPVEPTTSIRFLMLYKKVPKDFRAPMQVLTSHPRIGFVLVEWGGTNLDVSGSIE